VLLLELILKVSLVVKQIIAAIQQISTNIHQKLLVAIKFVLVEIKFILKLKWRPYCENRCVKYSKFNDAF
jgi:hypothetical protein